MPRAIVKLTSVREACDALDICPATFWKKWHRVFTDPRPPDERFPGNARKVYEDEVQVCIENGSGPRAAAAITNLRARLGRK